MKLAPGSVDDQLMAIAAHRYCLGRASYIVGACLAWLRETWPDFTPNTRRTILRDTVEALMDRHTGMDMDTDGWLAFAGWAWRQLDDAGREWVMRAVAHKDQPWPLEEEPKP